MMQHSAKYRSEAYFYLRINLVNMQKKVFSSLHVFAVARDVSSNVTNENVSSSVFDRLTVDVENIS